MARAKDRLQQCIDIKQQQQWAQVSGEQDVQPHAQQQQLQQPQLTQLLQLALLSVQLLHAAASQHPVPKRVLQLLVAPPVGAALLRFAFPHQVCLCVSR
jgi:hypothetical protein